jgi:hypothetical protein
MTKNPLLELIDKLFCELWNQDKKFRDYQEACFDIEAVTGKVEFDHFVAAQLLKAYATAEHPETIIPHLSLAAIVRHMNAIRRRYYISPKQRMEEWENDCDLS